MIQVEATKGPRAEKEGDILPAQPGDHEAAKRAQNLQVRSSGQVKAGRWAVPRAKMTGGFRSPRMMGAKPKGTS